MKSAFAFRLVRLRPFPQNGLRHEVDRVTEAGVRLHDRIIHAQFAHAKSDQRNKGGEAAKAALALIRLKRDLS